MKRAWTPLHPRWWFSRIASG